MFKIKHVLLLSFTIIALTIAGCKSQFEKIRLSNDVAKKYQEAMKLYNKKNYSKAIILFEDLSQKYRGRAEAEDLNYYYALTLYKLRDYTTARYQFKSFADTYPTSKYAEECRYLGAYCYYLESPKSSLDQENTYKAIDALQLFINFYPKSERVADASKYIADLRAKLETKAFENAKLYYDLGAWDISNYKSAVIALKNAQIDFPDIKYAEEMDLLIVKSQYSYAKNSIELRQEDRYNEAITYADEFVESHPQSKLVDQAKALKKDSEAGIEHAKRVIAEFQKDQEKYKAMLEKEAKADSTNTKIKTPIK
ncbi:outer membrane protein assembly factor BamD [Pedobacter steynii]|uniref:Outer membrane protein assembly factor BamD n=1 Tax=Pedobacter steynii TaxID=430522 RepID=A0A1H0IM25_9SPHI|nr:outer membrane protein assembly factor BamD [Pedobacter steynii]NQX42948.1 outer membrane protein assembly factor BamD [Pedobacter steynii]SDO32477.1 outer membrane protein assembly factor BamD [Pedobacter steynii]